MLLYLTYQYAQETLNNQFVHELNFPFILLDLLDMPLKSITATWESGELRICGFTASEVGFIYFISYVWFMWWTMPFWISCFPQWKVIYDIKCLLLRWLKNLWSFASSLPSKLLMTMNKLKWTEGLCYMRGVFNRRVFYASFTVCW